MKRKINVALIGPKFMGKAHSNAIRSAAHFFELDCEPVMKTLCGVSEGLEATAKLYGWQKTERDWHKVVSDPEIDCVAICTPGNLHKVMAVETAKNGKHVICEKPLANTLEEAETMLSAVQESGVINFVNFNYRRVPAVVQAKKLIEEGRLGDIVHYRAIYQQDWAAYVTGNYVWRFDNEISGGGAIADMGSHVIDLGRFLVGEYDEAVCTHKTVIPYKINPTSGEKKSVTSDDAANFMATFKNGVSGVFQTSRVSVGKKNWLSFEVNGTKGSVVFNLERMNELEVYLSDSDEDVSGFRNVIVTQPCHNYIKNWWPTGHIIGWEHTFVHQYYEFFTAITSGVQTSPSFADGVETQRVIECLLKSDKTRQWVKI